MIQSVKGALVASIAAAALIPAIQARAGSELDLTATGVATGTIANIDGVSAIFSRDNHMPTGTGVFDPFQTTQSPGASEIEQGYNTSGGLPLNDLRNHWNVDVQKKDLGSVNIGGTSYYVFNLDANETGQGTINRFLSIDNIRIYTSPTGSQTTSNPDALGTLRYRLNSSLTSPLSNEGNWVKIDASRNDITGQVTSGSGSADLLVYIPTSTLDGAAADDFVYFYTMMGAHYQIDPGTGAEAGFEEWAHSENVSVPDGGSTLLLLGAALTGIATVNRQRKALRN